MGMNVIVPSYAPQATFELGSCAKQASRTASETWSQILSGCPSLTDSAEGGQRVKTNRR
jgi:hypothetical protein